MSRFFLRFGIQKLETKCLWEGSTNFERSVSFTIKDAEFREHTLVGRAIVAPFKPSCSLAAGLLHILLCLSRAYVHFLFRAILIQYRYDTGWMYKSELSRSGRRRKKRRKAISQEEDSPTWNLTVASAEAVVAVADPVEAHSVLAGSTVLLRAVVCWARTNPKSTGCSLSIIFLFPSCYLLAFLTRGGTYEFNFAIRYLHIF